MPSNPLPTNMPNTSELALIPRPSRRISGDPYLKFQLAPDTIAALNMRQIQEVRILPIHRLTPIPNMLPHVLGLINQRSQVQWAIDLAQLVGFPGLGTNLRQYEMLLIRTGAIAFGLAVQKIETAIWVPRDSVQPIPKQVSPTLFPFLQGCMTQEQTVALIFDTETISQAAMTMTDRLRE